MRPPRHASPPLALALAALAGAGLLTCGSGPSEAKAPEPPPAGEPEVSSLRTVAEWQALFERAWERERATYLEESTSANSWRHYSLAYAVDGLTAMFEATGDTRFLDGALLYVENVVESAAPSSALPGSQYGDRFRGWLAWGHPDRPERRGEYALYESYLFRYVGKLLRAMREAPAVWSDARYRARHDAILAFTKEHVWTKWTARGANANVYRERTHMAAHWAALSLELWAATSDPAERARYREVVDDVNRHLPNHRSSLRQQLRPHPDDSRAWFWSARWGEHSRPGQDVSHGNGVVAYVVEAHRLGVEWTDDDIARFVRTLRDHVWKPEGRFASHVDGSGAGNGWINDGFVKLGRYDAEIQQRLERHDVGRNVQLYGNAALNAKMLRERRRRALTPRPARAPRAPLRRQPPRRA